MFSRTTIASSISRPTHSDSAISVIMLIVKPNRYMNRKVPISAIGSVRPVMTVERQEFRNRKTISTVSAAPSISVRCTLATDTRIERELSRIDLEPARRAAAAACASASACVQAVDHLDGVLALRLLHRQQHRALAVVERQALDLLRAVDDVGDLADAGTGRRRRACARR